MDPFRKSLPEDEQEDEELTGGLEEDVEDVDFDLHDDRDDY